MVNTTRTLATGTFLRTAVNGRSRAAPSLGVESLKFRQKYCWPFFQKPFSSVILTFSTSASFGHWLAKLCWWWHCVLWRDEPASVLFEGREFRFLTSPLHPRPLFLEGGNIHGNITHCDADPFNGCLSFWRLNIVWWLQANIAEHTCPSIDSFQSWHNTWLHQGVFLFQGQTKSPPTHYFSLVSLFWSYVALWVMTDIFAFSITRILSFIQRYFRHQDNMFWS